VRAGKDVSGVEVVIGFAVGYWVGTRQGREGLQNALASAQAIWAHPETKKLLGQGLSAVETVAVPALERARSKSRRTALLSSVMDELFERHQARHAA
jgi:hypothetical protein